MVLKEFFFKDINCRFTGPIIINIRLIKDMILLLLDAIELKSLVMRGSDLEFDELESKVH